MGLNMGNIGMESSDPRPTIRFEIARQSLRPRPVKVRNVADCAEELAEVETVVNRAMLLLRRDLKKAA